MLVRKGTYKNFIAQFYGANLVVNIKDQSRWLLFLKCEWRKKECGSPGKDCDGISETLRWFN